MVAILLGALCGLVSWLPSLHAEGFTQDFVVLWTGAKSLLAHQDPYALRNVCACALNGTPYFYYPLTTALAATPFTILPVAIAGPVWIAISCGLVGYGVTRDGWWRLAIFLAPNMIQSILSATASPFILASMLLPWLGWTGVIKPNLGLAGFAYRPSVRTAAVVAAVLVASLFAMPNWPSRWLETAFASHYHFSPWRVPGGFLIAAAVVRWRRPEARMLAVLGVVPSSPIIYEALPIFLIPRTLREVVVLSAASSLAFMVTLKHSVRVDPVTYMALSQPTMVWLVYMPALIMVIKRPNKGTVPLWLERAASHLPSRLRGSPT